MAGGLSIEYLLTIFYTINRPMTDEEIRTKRGKNIDGSVLNPMLWAGVHHGYVLVKDGRFTPSEKLLSYGIERMQEAVTLYQDWLDALKKQQESLSKESE